MDYQLGPGPLQVDQNTIDEKIKGDIGIVENGDVATHAIPSGYYVIWKGDLYVAKTDISSGTTLSASNLTAKPNGLGAEVAALNSNTTFHPQLNSDTVSTAILDGVRYGKVCKITFNINVTTVSNGWVTVATIPAGYIPVIRQYGICAIDSTVSAGEGKIAEVRVDTNGELQIYTPIAKAYWGGITYMCS